MSDEPFKPITRAHAAEILSVSISGLDCLIKSGALPAPRKLPGVRQLYWHPKVFYALLHRALAGEDSSAPEAAGPSGTDSELARVQVRTTAEVPPSSCETPEVARSVKEEAQAPPKPERKRGSADARARQVARIRKLNE